MDVWMVLTVLAYPLCLQPQAPALPPFCLVVFTVEEVYIVKVSNSNVVLQGMDNAMCSASITTWSDWATACTDVTTCMANACHRLQTGHIGSH